MLIFQVIALKQCRISPPRLKNRPDRLNALDNA